MYTAAHKGPGLSWFFSLLLLRTAQRLQEVS